MEEVIVRLTGPKVIVESQGHLFRLKVPGYASGVHGGGRGLVSEFSRQSRKRMLELLARIDTERAGFLAFVTLTYPDRSGPPSALETERDRQAFLKRVKRAFPEASAIWRREWDLRESGQFVGVAFPHYHLLFFGLPFFPHEDLNEMWVEVLGCEEYVRTEIKGVRSWRQAFFYVAKYMAKAADDGPAAGGPPSGEGGRPAAGSGGEAASCSLVYGTYLTGREGQESGKRPSIGRSWGVFNRRCLPMAERRKLALPHGPWVYEARGLGSRQWPGMPDYPGSGFSLFVDNADDWVKCMVALQELCTWGVLPEDESILMPVRGGR